MTGLHDRLADYLSVRRGLGFKLERAGLLLADFVTFMDREGATNITTALALAWAADVQGGANWRAGRLVVVRGFAQYVQAIDPATEVPPADLLPREGRRAAPFIYSEVDILGLMSASQGLRTRIRRSTYATLIGLLAVTGMRVGEAIQLDRSDISWKDGVLMVRNAKLGKSRLVPLHSTTVQALHEYARLRDESVTCPRNDSFFVTPTGTRLLYCNVQSTFSRLTRAAGIQPRSQRCRPRLHDLRHTFTVRSVMGWYRDGLDVPAKLPILSTYLGHTNPRATYWYLSGTPELLGLAAQRLQASLGELP